MVCNTSILLVSCSSTVCYIIQKTSTYVSISRLYLVSRLPFLSYLDDRIVEWEERKEAQSMYHIASKSLKCGLRGNPSDFSNKAAIEAGINPSPSTSPLHSTTRQQTAFAWKQKLKILWEDIVLRTGAPQSL